MQGLFELAADALDEEQQAEARAREKLEREFVERLHQDHLRTVSQIRKAFGVDPEMQAHHYGNEYPGMGGLLLGPVWFSYSCGWLKGVYQCPQGCNDNSDDVYVVTFYSGDTTQVNLASLARLINKGCAVCGHQELVLEPGLYKE